MTNEHNQEQSGVGSKIMTGMVVGALAGAAVVMFDSNSRSKVINSVGQAKDFVIKMSNDVKEDPTAAKNQMMERVQSATAVLKEAINDLQKIVSSVKETGEDLQDVGSKAVEAKDELLNNTTR